MGSGESRPENVTFNFDVDGGTVTVNAKKSEQAIKDDDRAVFNLLNQDLIVKKYFQRDPLTPVFCSSNTSDYTLRWDRVQMVMYPVGAKIVKQSRKAVTVQSTELRNPSAERGEFKWTANKSEILKETYKHTWTAENNVAAKIDIAFKILSLGTISFSRKTTESVVTERHRTSETHTHTEIKVTLGPYSSVRVKVQAIFHIVDIEVEYEASLCGFLEVFYGRRRLGWLYTNVLTDIPDSRTTATYKEIITLQYYKDGDRITMNTIASGTNTRDTSSWCIT